MFDAAKQGPSGPVHLIALVGGSGSGKTWLANRLQRIFGGECSVLSQDDFYRDLGHLSLRRRARVNFDHPRAIDWPRIESVLRRWTRGRAARVPRYDFAEHRRLPPGPVRLPGRLVIVEGLWLLRRPALRRLFSLTVFLQCPELVRLNRRLRRDCEERGRTPASVREQFRDRVAPMHERFVAPQAKRADLCLPGLVSPAQLDQLVRRIEALKRGG